MSKRNVIGIVVRFIAMLFGFAVCTSFIVLFKGENPTGYAGPIIGYLVAIVLPWGQPMEFHEDYHQYAKELYNTLSSVKASCLNDDQICWTNRLLAYLDGCSARECKVTPDEMKSYILSCITYGKETGFGQSTNILLDEVDDVATELFYDELVSSFDFC